ncbi:hypothetical protein COHA_000248 [Chlorella ohadii]|uniref:Uncharacterized protein n=1 Tax=Chlorella ohadii TaxID=2649997 RepID=A0AAD5E0S4_9CHLO|nr:hypothetical protein COHA_000248 [Chlorella ohadii]
MTAAQPPPWAPAKQQLVTTYHVEVLAGEEPADTLPLANGAAATDGRAAAEQAAAQAAAAVEDDETMLDEPQEEKHMSEAKAKAAAELAKQGDHKAAVEMWSQAINGDPANPVLYCKRGYSYMQLRKEPDAVRDFTICLDLPKCPAEQQFQALLSRGMIKHDLGDLSAGDADLVAAYKAAPGPQDQEQAKAERRLLVQKRVTQTRKEEERKDASNPVVHRYKTAIIEEIDADDESADAQEALVHERVAAWEEARGSAARLAKALEAERKRIREENKARAERNAVRAARRREAAERARQAVQQAQQAEQAERERQLAAQGPGKQQQVWVERTRIPIQIVEVASGGGGKSSMAESSRSTGSRLAGHDSESESEAAPGAAGAAVGQAAAEQQTEQAEEQPQPGQPATDERAAKPGTPPSNDAKPADKPAAEDSPVAVASAEASQATAAAEEEEKKEVSLLEAAEALAAADEAQQAAAENEEEEEEEAEGEAEAAADGEPAPAAVGAPLDAQEERPFVAPSSQERAAAMLTEEQLDALKEEADQLQKELKHDAAEERYARYLRLRPSDPRAWSNRAENCIKLERWQEALQYCNAGLGITTPSHPLGKHRLFSRRGRAYQSLGKLQEALADFEAAEAAAEADGDIKGKHDVTKRIAKLLRDMQARGIERAPRTAAQLGMQAAAAAQQLDLPSIPVVPHGPQHEVPESVGVAEEEGQQQQQKQKQPKKQQAAPKQGQAAAAAGAGAAAGHQAVVEGAAAPQEAAAAAGALAAGAAAAGGNADSAPAGAGELAEQQRQASVQEKLQGNACFQRHQWRKALRHYDRAIELDPKNKEALCNKAASLLKLKEWQEAAAAAEQALICDPQYLKARHRKAHAHAGMYEWNLAVLNLQIVEDGMSAEGQALDKEDQRFLAEWRRKQEEDVANGLCSFAF